MAVSCICQQGFVPQQGGCGGYKNIVSVCQINLDDEDRNDTDDDQLEIRM